MTKLSRGLVLFFVVALIATACAADTPAAPDASQDPPEVADEGPEPGPEPETQPNQEDAPIDDPAPAEDTDAENAQIEDLEVADDDTDTEELDDTDSGPDAIELSPSDVMCRDRTDGSELDPTSEERCLRSEDFTVEFWQTDTGLTIEVSELDVDPATEVILFIVGEAPVGFQWKNQGTFDAFYGPGFENFDADPGASIVETGEGTVTFTNIWVSVDDDGLSVANPGGTTLGGMEVPPGQHPLVEMTIFIGDDEIQSSFLFTPLQLVDAFATTP